MEQSADLAGEVGFPWWRSRMLRKLADCQLELGRPDQAELTVREALELMADIGDHQMIVFTLARLARIGSESGRAEEAGLIWGAIEAEEERAPMGAWAKERDRLGASILALSGPEFERGLREGRLLSLDEAVEHALGERS
jgi:hypothetical protein